MKTIIIKKVLLLVAVALVGVLFATSCEKEKNGISDGQDTNPPDVQNDTTSSGSSCIDPFMDSIYKSFPNPDTSVMASIDGFNIFGRWCWKSNRDTVCSMILDFDETGMIRVQCFKSDEACPNRIGLFSNVFFNALDSCTYVVRHDTLFVPIQYYGPMADTIMDPNTLSIPFQWGIPKIRLYNNQTVMYLLWSGDCGGPGTYDNGILYLTKQN